MQEWRAVRAVREVRALREVRDKQGIGGTREGGGGCSFRLYVRLCMCVCCVCVYETLRSL